MIRFFSTKMYSNVKEMDCYDCNDYPINRLSIDSIWSQKSKKITRCVVVSAYTDCEWIDQIVK